MSGDRWFIDPLDGTTNFAYGHPAAKACCSSTAYERDGELGRVQHLRRSFCWNSLAAERGAGARLGERRIAVSTIERTADALLCTGFKTKSDYERNAIAVSRCFGARAGRAARRLRPRLISAYVACGRWTATGSSTWRPRDGVAGTLLVREAGGRVSQVDGSAARLDAASILATNARIHEEVSAVLVEG